MTLDAIVREMLDDLEPSDVEDEWVAVPIRYIAALRAAVEAAPKVPPIEDVRADLIRRWSR